MLAQGISGKMQWMQKILFVRSVHSLPFETAKSSPLTTNPPASLCNSHIRMQRKTYKDYKCNLGMVFIHILMNKEPLVGRSFEILTAPLTISQEAHRE